MVDYREIFPTREPIDVAIPTGFVDESWGDDTCPKFVNRDLRLCLWVEETNPDQREWPTQARFTLVRIILRDGDDWEFDDNPATSAIEESEDWNDILAAIEREKIAA